MATLCPSDELTESLAPGGALQTIHRGPRLGVVLALALLLAIVWGGQPAEASAPYGYDLSFPQCKLGLPPVMAGHHIVGVNGGRPFESNPCFTVEYRWASAGNPRPAIYMNLDYPHGWSSSYGNVGPRGQCAPNDQTCKAYNYGYKAAADAVRRAGPVAQTAWWLDIETANLWSPNHDLNAEIINGALSYFRSHQLAVGIYSIGPMWQKIAGNFTPRVPVWVAQWQSGTPTMAFCSSGFSFGGGSVAMVQVSEGQNDFNYLCPGATWLTSSPLSAPATNPGEGTLESSHGGSTTQLAVAATPGEWVSYRLSLSAAGPDVTNGLFVAAYQDGAQILQVHAIDTPTPGTLQLKMQSHSSSSIIFVLTSYDDPAKVPTVGYDFERE